MDRAHNTRRTALVCALLPAATLFVFWPLLGYDFIVFDDGDYVSRNAIVQHGLTGPGLEWAFTAVHASNWHPLTWISHMLDCQLYGLKPGAHHLTNLLLHAANAVLLFVALRRMTGALWPSSLVAALFALHPLHVESVAWIAERKDVLSGLFFMLTLLAYSNYVRWAEKQKSGEKSVAHCPWSAVWYCATFVLFAMGLMSKPMLVTLPFVLLLLDYWPFARVPTADGRANVASFAALLPLLKEKVPFFALSAASSIATLVAQKTGGAVAPLEYVSFPARLGNALVAYVTYLQKTVWPAKLAILYLRPEAWPPWRITLALALLVTATGLVVVAGGKRAWLRVGWFWYLGMLVPVIGLVQVGNQFMADRYTYLPLIGLFLILSWGGAALAEKYKLNAMLLWPPALLVLVAAGADTRRQIGFWRNSETVFGHCLEVTEKNYVAHNLLGAALGPQGKFEQAKAQFLAALDIQPNYVEAIHNLGILLTEHGDYEEAKSHLQVAVRLKPELAVTYGKLALVLDAQGRTEQAIAYYRECVRLRPDQTEVCNNLAWLLATHAEARFRDGNEAVRLAEHACELTGYQQAVLAGTLAASYAEAGRFRDAVATAEKAISLATSAGQTELADRNRQLLERYRQGKPAREGKPNDASLNQ